MKLESLKKYQAEIRKAALELTDVLQPYVLDIDQITFASKHNNMEHNDTCSFKLYVDPHHKYTVDVYLKYNFKSDPSKPYYVAFETDRYKQASVFSDVQEMLSMAVHRYLKYVVCDTIFGEKGFETSKTRAADSSALWNEILAGNADKLVELKLRLTIGGLTPGATGGFEKAIARHEAKVGKQLKVFVTTAQPSLDLVLGMYDEL